MTLPRAIGAWVRQDDPVRYDRETIFDYINGAGEVYRSYAFGHVDVERYQGPEGEKVTVEIFDMGTPADAFGVFSYAREDEQEGIGAGFERKGSILCFWQDRYYVCVAMELEHVDPGPVLEDVARGISGALPPGGDRPPLVGALPPEGLIPFSDRYFHLHQTLNYNYYLMRENVLNLSPQTNAVLARYAPGSTYLVLVEYQDETDAEMALSSFRAGVTPGIGGPAATGSDEGRFVSSAQEGPFLVLVLEGSTREATDALRTEALARLTALRNESGPP
ncbi:MAG: DUF6599 family protein [Longimicrobiales bacterium]